MITLYDYLPSQNAWKVRLLLNQLQLPYQQKFISIFEGEGQGEDFLRVNPTGAVPAIRLENGETIAESNAILVYLAQNTRFLPGDPVKQAQVMQWLFFEADYVQASVATLRHWVLTGKDKNRSQAMLDAKRAASNKVLGILNNTLQLHEFLSGDTYTIADIAVFSYVHLAQDAGLELDDLDHLNRWIDSVKTQPHYLNEVHPYSLDAHSYKEL